MTIDKFNILITFLLPLVLLYKLIRYAYSRFCIRIREDFGWALKWRKITGFTNFMMFLVSGKRPKKTPDFFLSSGDDYVFAKVRACYVIRTVLVNHGTRTALLVRIDPPVTPDDYSCVKSIKLDSEMHHVVLTEKWEGTSIYPKVSKWPLFVYVVQPFCDIEKIGNELGPNEYSLLSWSEIYRTEEEAQRMYEQFLGWNKDWISTFGKELVFDANGKLVPPAPESDIADTEGNKRGEMGDASERH